MNIDLELVRAISAFGTAAGVAFAAVQLWRSKQQQILRFEDEIAREYREIARKIPVEALLGKNPNDNSEALNSIYTYIDFCNEQIFLRKKGRIRRSTWDNWLNKCSKCQYILVKPFVLSLSKDKQIKCFIYTVSTFMVRQAHHERGNSKVYWYLERLFRGYRGKYEASCF